MTELPASLAAALADRYTLERELGRGGMAIVYLARDLKHDRQVALKVVQPGVAQAVRGEQFLREIQIAAKLTHPHILGLHDSGAAGGFLYYVMPYVEGESLRHRLDREKQLPLDEALRITRDVASALGEAHAQGVVHRDIKPENILLTKSGHAVVADFGIARALAVTGGAEPGLVAGTAAYMSPEQGGGSATLDGRSDLYSLGCVLYEMLTGHPPFGGATAQEILARHTLDAVPTLRAARPGVPRAVERALAKALAKVPADRFASAAQFADALAGPRRRLPVYAALGVLVVVAGAIAARSLLRSPSEQSVAVLPFVNLSGDTGNEYFSDGMTEDLIDALTQVSGLRIPARTSSFVFKGKNVPIADIGRQLNVAHVVEGSVRRAGSELRVTAQLINVADGFHLWSQHYERQLRSAHDVFAVQDEIARAIVAALELKLTAGVGERADRPSTNNLQAYDLYERGRYQWYKRTPDATQKAVGYFEQAIRLDSGYAPAYSGLADAYTLMGQFGFKRQSEVYPAAKKVALMAIQVDSNLAEAWVSLAQVRNHDWDWSGAEAAFRRGIRLNPKYPLGHAWYGRFLAEVMGVVGRSEDGIREARIAQKLDPLSTAMNASLADALRYGSHYNEAIEYYRRAIDLEPDVATWHDILGRTYLAKGEYRQAQAEFDSARRLRGEDTNMGWRAFIYAKTGRRDEAIQIVRQLEEEWSRGSRRAMQRAAAYLGLGDRDKTFAVLRQAVAKHTFPTLSGFFQEQLGSDPRFDQLIKEMGLKQ